MTHGDGTRTMDTAIYCLDTQEWKDDCMKWRGRVLSGHQSHWCYEWDGLPVDETTPEWPCPCGFDRDRQLEALKPKEAGR